MMSSCCALARLMWISEGFMTLGIFALSGPGCGAAGRRPRVWLTPPLGGTATPLKWGCMTACRKEEFSGLGS